MNIYKARVRLNSETGKFEARILGDETISGEQKMIDLIKGERIELVIVIETDFGERKDLTDFDQYKVCLGGFEATEVASANGSIVTKNGSDDKGELFLLVTPLDSDTLNAGSRQDLSIEISQSTSSSQIERYNIDQVLNIEEFGC